MSYGPADILLATGEGPRCGCGQRSALHVIERGGARFDYFLCDSCLLGATITWLAARQQDRFGSDAGTTGSWRAEQDSKADKWGL